MIQPIVKLLRKMYPMKSQIWRFFEKLGISSNMSNTKMKKIKTSNTMTVSTRFTNPFDYIMKRNRSDLRPARASDSDNMLMRYSLITTACITVAILLAKILRFKNSRRIF